MALILKTRFFQTHEDVLGAVLEIIVEQDMRSSGNYHFDTAIKKSQTGEELDTFLHKNSYTKFEISP